MFSIINNLINKSSPFLRFEEEFQEINKKNENHSFTVEECQKVQRIYDETLPYWPQPMLEYQDYYKGLILFFLSRAELEKTQDVDKINLIIDKFRHAYILMKDNNFQYTWINCALSLGEAYFNHRKIGGKTFIKEAIEITENCLDVITNKKLEEFSVVKIYEALGDYYFFNNDASGLRNYRTSLKHRKYASLLNKKKYGYLSEQYGIAKSKEADAYKELAGKDHPEMFSSALDAYKEAENILSHSKNCKFISENYIKYAIFLLNSSLRDEQSIKSSLRMMKKAYSYADKISSEDLYIIKEIFATALSQFSGLNSSYDQELAISFFQELADDERHIESQKEVADIYLILGNIYANRVMGSSNSNNRISLKYYAAAINYSRQERQHETFILSTIYYYNISFNCMLDIKKEEILGLKHEIDQALSNKDILDKWFIGELVILNSIAIENLYNASLTKETPVEFLSNFLKHNEKNIDKEQSFQIKMRLFKIHRNYNHEVNSSNFESEAPYFIKYFQEKGHIDKVLAIKSMIADNFYKNKNYQEAYDIFCDIFTNIYQNITPSAESMQAKYALFNLIEYLEAASVCAAMIGKADHAIEFTELLRDRDMLNRVRNHSLSEDSDIDYINGKYAKMISQSLNNSYGTDRKEIIEKINNIIEKDSTENNIEEEHIEIKTLLSDLEQWVLMPILGNDIFFITVIPPSYLNKEPSILGPYSRGKNYINENTTSNELNKKNYYIPEFIRDRIGERVLDWDDMSSKLTKSFDIANNLLSVPIRDFLKKHEINDKDKVCIIVNKEIGMIPIGLVDIDDGVTFCEKYNITYAFSLASLYRSSQNIAYKNIPSESLSIMGRKDNNNLKSANLEIDIVSNIMSSFSIYNERFLSDIHETKKYLERSRYWHFAAHGYFDEEKPINSFIELPDGEQMTIFRLNYIEMEVQLRLVVLSCCQAAIYDFDEKMNSYDSFSSSLIYLGAAAVISALWPVSDEASTVFMSRFYKLHIKGILPPAQALRETRVWMKNATIQDILDHLHSVCVDGKTRLALERSSLYKELIGLPNDAIIFSHPYFWGAYIMHGV